jgi:predicted metal-dependent hydrolase
LAKDQILDLSYQGDTFSIMLRKTRRRSLALHVFPDRPAELRAPLNSSDKTIRRFLDEKLPWLYAALHEVAPDAIPEPTRYRDGESVDYLGREHQLRFLWGRPAGIEQVGDQLLVRASGHSPGTVQKLVERFVRQQALALLPGRLATCRERFAELPAHTFRVRKMRARWGSCSRRGEICLNSLLMQKSWPAIDFVVTHELCHLRHFAHNKSFYALMDRVMPDWREREKLLEAGNAILQMDLF